MVKIKISPLAVTDLKEINSYISEELSNPMAANRIIKKMSMIIHYLKRRLKWVHYFLLKSI